MGRKRLLKLHELERRTMYCKCGEPVQVDRKDVISVLCCYCASGVTPIRTVKQLMELDKREEEAAKKQKEKESALLVNGKKKRGRPKGSKNRSTLEREAMAKKLKERVERAVELSVAEKIVDEVEKEEAVAKKTKSTKKRGRGRPRKAVVKKGKTMEEKKDAPVKAKRKSKKTSVKKGTGKRGRRPTVGAAILKLLNEADGGVKFNDILSTYSETRKEMGKQDSPNIEERNCRSTLYIMKRNGKIRELEPKTVYAKA